MRASSEQEEVEAKLVQLPELVPLEGLVPLGVGPTVPAHKHQGKEHSPALGSEPLAADPEPGSGS